MRRADGRLDVCLMKAAVETKLLALSRKLSPKKRRELLTFGQKLYAQEEKKLAVIEEEGDAAWERIIADPKPRPKLQALADKALAEYRAGKTTPLPRT